MNDPWFASLSVEHAPVSEEARAWCKHCNHWHRPVGPKALAAQRAYDAVFGTDLAERALAYKASHVVGTSPKCGLGQYEGPEPMKAAPVAIPEAPAVDAAGIPQIVSYTHEALLPPPILDKDAQQEQGPFVKASPTEMKPLVLKVQEGVPVLAGDVPDAAMLEAAVVNTDPLAAPAFLLGEEEYYGDEDDGDGEDEDEDDDDASF
jgi:hypothetical protein